MYVVIITISEMRNKLLKTRSGIRLIPSGSKIKLGNRKLESESSRQVSGMERPLVQVQMAVEGPGRS